MTQYLPALFGGMLLGFSAILLLVVNGRIAGISGIVGRLLGGHQIWINAAFVAGLLTGPILYAVVYGQFPEVTIAASWPLALASGLLVGAGSRAVPALRSSIVRKDRLRLRDAGRAVV